MSSLVSIVSGEMNIPQHMKRQLKRVEEELNFKGILLFDNSYVGSDAGDRWGDGSLKTRTIAYEELGRRVSKRIAEGRDTCFPYEAWEELHKNLIYHKAQNRDKRDRTRLVKAIEDLHETMVRYPCEKYISENAHNLEPLMKFMKDITSMPGILQSGAKKCRNNSAYEEHLEHDGIIAAKLCAIALANPTRKVGLIYRDGDLDRIGREIKDSIPFTSELAELYGFDDDPTVFDRLRFFCAGSG